MSHDLIYVLERFVYLAERMEYERQEARLGNYCTCAGVRWWSVEQGLAVMMDRSGQCRLYSGDGMDRIRWNFSKQWERKKGIRDDSQASESKWVDAVPFTEMWRLERSGFQEANQCFCLGMQSRECLLDTYKRIARKCSIRSSKHSSELFVPRLGTMNT